MAERDDDFLRRWSRRKSESRENLPHEDPAGEGEAEDGADKSEIARLADEGPEDKDAEAEAETQLTEEDFKDFDFEALNFDSDYQQFMGKGIPEAIQRKALRKLWSSNPILANIDGLNDYDEDFTDAALAVDAIKTAYQVGRGYLTDDDLEEMSKIGPAGADDLDGDVYVAAADDGTAETTPESAPETTEDADVARADDDLSADPTTETDGEQGPDSDDDEESKTA